MLSEAKQETPIRDTVCGIAAIEMAYSKMPEVEVLNLFTPNYPASPL